MTSFGVLLVVLGVGSLVLPYLNLDISFLDSLDDLQPWAGVVVSALGLITVLFASRRRRPAEPESVAPAAAAPVASAAPAASAVPAAEAESKPWPTDPPERSDDD